MSTEIKNESTAEASAQILCSRVKELRKKRGWTLEELSVASGVSRSMLSQIERGQANPTLVVACRIAQTFGISIADLVDEPRAGSSITIIRSDDPTYLYRSDNQCKIRTLSPLNMERDMEFYEINLSSQAELESAAHFEGTHELLTVQKGSIEVTSGDNASKLKKGDSAHYRADVPHKIKSIGSREAICYLVVTYS